MFCAILCYVKQSMHRNAHTATCLFIEYQLAIRNSTIAAYKIERKKTFRLKNATVIYYALACSALIHMPFDGSFDDMSRQPQPIDVRGVTLSNSGSAYFDGIGYLTLPGTANLMLGETFVIKLRFRRRGDSNTQVGNWSSSFKSPLPENLMDKMLEEPLPTRLIVMLVN